MNLPKSPGRTTPAFGFSYVDRALQECLSERRFGRKEQAEVVSFFARWDERPSCAYCGALEVKRWDHVVPVAAGGTTVVGNMVLACQPCDDSKGKNPYPDWMRSGSPKSPTTREVPDIGVRVERIAAYVSHFGYRATSVEMRLAPSEVDLLARLRTDLQKLKSDVDGLIRDYRDRTGNK